MSNRCCRRWRLARDLLTPAVFMIFALGIVVCIAQPVALPPSNPFATMTQELLLQEAERGNAKAQNEVAFRYMRNPTRPFAERAADAVKWWQASAKQGDPTGQAFLGELYNRGVAVPHDKPEALRLFRLSAERGSPPGAYFLGRAYLHGDGVTQDYGEARTWIGKAAASNHADAQYELGRMFARGQGVPTDDTEAAMWFRRAADQGQPSAQGNLGAMYASGRGVPQDNIAAYFWLTVAVARMPITTPEGNTARTAAANGRDTVAKRLMPQEIERAQSLARRWKPGDPVDDALHRGLPLAPQGLARAAPAAPGATTQSARPTLTTGTGFVINGSGHVLTNAHVVDGCREIRARLPGDVAGATALVATDKANDLAVIKLSAPPAESALFRSAPSLRQGENVVVYGFPLPQALASDGTLTTGNVSALAGLRNDSRMLQISAPVQAGNSGGPLVDMSGQVVGVIVSKLNALAIGLVTGDLPQNVNFAIKSAVALGFLESNNIPYRTSAAAQPLQTSDVAERAKKFVVNIECRR